MLPFVFKVVLLRSISQRSVIGAFLSCIFVHKCHDKLVFIPEIVVVQQVLLFSQIVKGKSESSCFLDKKHMFYEELKIVLSFVILDFQRMNLLSVFRYFLFFLKIGWVFAEVLFELAAEIICIAEANFESNFAYGDG